MPRRKNRKGAPVAFSDTLGNLDKGAALEPLNLKVPPHLKRAMRQRAFDRRLSITRMILDLWLSKYPQDGRPAEEFSVEGAQARSVEGTQ